MIVNDQNQWQRQCAALAIICALAQLLVAPYLAIFGGHPNFCLIFAIVVSLTGKGSAALVMAFFAGIFFDLTATTPVGLMAFELTVVAFVLGFEERDRILEEPVIAYRDGCIAAIAAEAVFQLALAMVGQGGPFADVVFLRWLPAAFLDCLALVPFVFALSRPKADGLSLGVTGRTSNKGRRLKL